MATQTRFDLNAAIENWLNELAAQPQLSSDGRRELEKHLADTMAELRQRGLSEEESFWLACRRIGQPQQLAEEFEKADPNQAWRERVFWMAVGIMVFWQGILIISYIAGIILTFVGLNRFYGAVWSLFENVTLLLMGVLFAKGFLAKSSKLIWFLENRVRLAVLLMCVPILGDLAQQIYIVLGRVETSHEYLLLFDWESRVPIYFHLLLSYFQYSAGPMILIILFLPKQFRKVSKLPKLAQS
jgi:hypothetical protein